MKTNIALTEIELLTIIVSARKELLRHREELKALKIDTTFEEGCIDVLTDLRDFIYKSTSEYFKIEELNI